MLATLTAALCLVCGSALAVEDYALELLGEPFPDFAVETIDGDRFALSEVLENYDAVLVNLWASWCGPCEMEFPYLQEAYEAYGDRVAVIALSVEPEDSREVLLVYTAEHGMTFAVANGADTGLGETYAPEGIPTSVLVDRYGDAVLIEVGAQTSTAVFTRIFDAVLGEDYARGTVFYEIPPALPTVDRPDESALAEALNADGGQLSFANPEDVAMWPMVPVEIDGRSAVMTTNAGQDGSTAGVIAHVDAGDGAALAFDFRTSTEPALDLLTIDVDGETVKRFGGEHDWTAWAIPLEPGVHEIRFAYVKDAYEAAGEDVVYLDAVRLVSGEEAEAALASLPAAPVSDAFTLETVGDAKEIVFDDPEDILYEYYGWSSAWIVQDGTVTVAVTLREDMDAEAAFVYSDYDGVVTPVGSLGVVDDAYVFSCGVDSMAETGYSFSGVYAYADRDAYPGDGAYGMLAFVDEENVDAFVEQLAGMGIAVGWHYVDAGGSN